MILVDANILMYAAGADHPNKAPSAKFLRRVARGEVEAALDAEVLQEILYRYRSIGRWSQGRRVYDAARRLFPVVVPITSAVLDLARQLMDSHEELQARDALHGAVVLHQGAQAICSYDRDFDQIPQLKRIEPQDHAEESSRPG
ncbi:MAG: type II toxin-antitoxin system VapC family toxin [bacterium]|nr:type II toxin-antitoxin system VapC family toxin [bacterium]